LLPQIGLTLNKHKKEVGHYYSTLNLKRLSTRPTTSPVKIKLHSLSKLTWGKKKRQKHKCWSCF